MLLVVVAVVVTLDLGPMCKLCSSSNSNSNNIEATLALISAPLALISAALALISAALALISAALALISYYLVDESPPRLRIITKPFPQKKACFDGFLLVFYRITIVFEDFPSPAYVPKPRYLAWVPR